MITTINEFKASLLNEQVDEREEKKRIERNFEIFPQNSHAQNSPGDMVTHYINKINQDKLDDEKLKFINRDLHTRPGCNMTNR